MTPEHPLDKDRFGGRVAANKQKKAVRKLLQKQAGKKNCPAALRGKLFLKTASPAVAILIFSVCVCDVGDCLREE